MKKERFLMGFIYVIQSMGFYKIGMTEDPDGKRIHSYRTTNPSFEVVYYDLVKDRRKAERKLLDYFKKHRLRGEWHILTKAQVEQVPEIIDEFLFH